MLNGDITEIKGELFKWTPAGIHLLKVINDYIDKNGGRVNLLNKIKDEDRQARAIAWRMSYCGTRSSNPGRPPKRMIVLLKDKVKRKFKSPREAGEYLEVSADAVRSAARYAHRVRGWQAFFQEPKKKYKDG